MTYRTRTVYVFMQNYSARVRFACIGAKIQLTKQFVLVSECWDGLPQCENDAMNIVSFGAIKLLTIFFYSR